MSKSKFSSEERRSQILAAARTLFSQKGYAEVSLDEIAKRVGVSRPRVIQLFGSKQNIYEAIVEAAYAAHPMDQDLAGPIGRKDDVAVFEGFALHILKHTEDPEDREIFRILLYARLREDSFHRSHFHKKDTLMISRLTDYVDERVRDGAFGNIDPRTLIYCYQAMVSNLAIYKNVLGQMDFVTSEELSRQCARIFLEGIKETSGRPST